MAIFFHPDAFFSSNRNVMGRHAAGESFLRAHLLFSSVNNHKFFLPDMKYREAAEAYINKFLSQDINIEFIDRFNLSKLTDEVLFYPGPDINDQAEKRSILNPGFWSICGITHTTLSSRVQRSLSELLTAPVHPWDAIICTSKHVKTKIKNLFDSQIEYLRDRVGLSKVILPDLPIIPLGVHADDYLFTESEKLIARGSLGITDQDIVVLFLGRLSFHAKAHPIAMYQAVNNAAKKISSGRKVYLIECGWFHNEWIKNSFEEAAALICSNITNIRLDGRLEKERRKAWACADIFCSLSDNFQETFGLSPLEAMAAELPVVVSDWNGYKETVRDGIDGFRIPTQTLYPGSGQDLADQYALDLINYDQFSGYTSGFVSVDIEGATNAFLTLFQSSNLRKEMGISARQKVINTYDWKQVIPLYESLWNELQSIRTSSLHELNSSFKSWPARMDPYTLFQSYPSRILSLNDKVKMHFLSPEINSWLKLSKLQMVKFIEPIILSDIEIKRLISQLGNGKETVRSLISTFDLHRQSTAYRTIQFLVKLGVLCIVSA